MPSKIVKALKHVRGKKGQVPRMSTRKRKIAEYYGQKRMEAMWEQDKATVRGYNFEKAQAGLEAYRAVVQEEKDRQAAIREARLKNLKKARKAKRRKYGNPTE